MSFGIKKTDLVEVSGLIDDVDAEITDMRAELYDFNGQQQVSTCLKLSLRPVTGEDVHTEYYRVGDPNKIQPDEDGLGCGPAPGSNAKGYNSRSKAGRLLEAFSDILGDATPARFDGFRGMVVHFDRKPFDMTGIKRESGAKDVTILLPTRVVKAGGKATATAAPGGAGNVNTDAERAIAAAVTALGGSATATNAGKQIFKAEAKNPNVKAIMKLTMDKAWLGADERPWVYDPASGEITVQG